MLPEEKFKLDEQDSLIPISILKSPKTIKETPTKSYNDSLHENSRNRRDLLSVFNNQVTEFHTNKLPNSDSTTVNGIPALENEVSNKIFVEDESDKETVLGFEETLQNYLTVIVGNTDYILTKYD